VLPKSKVIAATRTGAVNAQLATLDGQMSRNGQYVHASAPGFGV
jgi:hypothetical protein